jgi:hypothetical protein
MGKPRVRLVGEDGNAFFILGRCRRVARAAGWDEEQLDVFMNKAMDGDYDHLLRTVAEHFEIADNEDD